MVPHYTRDSRHLVPFPSTPTPRHKLPLLQCQLVSGLSLPYSVYRDTPLVESDPTLVSDPFPGLHLGLTCHGIPHTGPLCTSRYTDLGTSRSPCTPRSAPVSVRVLLHYFLVLGIGTTIGLFLRPKSYTTLW